MENNSKLQKIGFVILKIIWHLTILVIAFMIARLAIGYILGMLVPKLMDFEIYSMMNENLYNILLNNIKSFGLFIELPIFREIIPSDINNTPIVDGITSLYNNYKITLSIGFIAIISIFIIPTLKKIESKNKFKDFFKTLFYYIYSIINPFYLLKFLFLNIKIGLKNTKIMLGIVLFISIIILFFSYIPTLLLNMLVHIVVIGYIYYIYYFSISKEDYSWKNILLCKIINMNNISFYWKNIHLAIISIIYIWIIVYLSVFLYVLFLTTIIFLGDNLLIYMTLDNLLAYIIIPTFGIYSLIYFIPTVLKKQYKKIGVFFIISIILWAGSFKYISVKFFNNDFPLKPIKGQVFDFGEGLETINYFLSDQDIEKLVKKNTGIDYREIETKLYSDKYTLVCGNFNSCQKEELNISGGYLFSEDREKIYLQQRELLESKNKYNAYDIYALGISFSHTMSSSLNSKITEDIVQIENKKIIPSIMTILINSTYYKYNITSYKENIAKKIIGKNLKKQSTIYYSELTKHPTYKLAYIYAFYNEPKQAREIEKIMWENIEKKCFLKQTTVDNISNLELNKELENIVKSKKDETIIKNKKDKDIIKSLEDLDIEMNLNEKETKMLENLIEEEKSNNIIKNIEKCKKYFRLIRDYHKLNYINFTNGNIKGNIKVLDENDKELVYGRDYELILYRWDNKDHNQIFYSQNLDTHYMSKIVSEEVEQNFDISGITNHDTYSFVPVFKDDFHSYEFIKGNLNPINLSKEKSTYNYGDIILKINNTPKKIIKKGKKKNYYYLINYNNEVISIPKSKIKELTNGKICIYGKGSDDMYIKQEDCKYNKLLGIQYLFDFDNMKYIKFNQAKIKENNTTYIFQKEDDKRVNNLFIGEGKIFTKFAFSCKAYKENCDTEENINLECCEKISENKKIEYFTEWENINKNIKIIETINIYFN